MIPTTLPTPGHSDALLRLAGLSVWRFDHTRGLLMASASTLSMMAGRTWSGEDMGLDEWCLALAAEDRPVVSAWFRLSAHPDHHTLRFKLRGAHGVWTWLEVQGQVLTRAPDGTPTLSEGLVSDVSADARREEHFRLMQAFSDVVSASPDRHTLSQAILDAVLALPDLDGGGLYWRQPDGAYVLHASRGLSDHFVASVARIEPGSERASIIEAGGLVCSCADVGVPTSDTYLKDPRLVDRADPLAEGIVCLLVLPIQANGQYVACLNLASKHARLLPDTTAALLRQLARQFGLALERLLAREDANAERVNLEGFFSSLRDYVVVLDVQGNIIYNNPAVSDKLGYGDRLLGQHVLNMHPPRVREQAQHLLADMLAGKTDSCPLPLLTASGEEIWVDTKVVYGQWNGHPALLGVSRDIGELRALQAQAHNREQYLRAVLDNFPFLVWMKDEQGRFLAVNAPFAQLCGVKTPQDLTGKTDLDVWPEDLARSYQADDRAVLASGTSKQVEEWVQGEAGRHWIETYKSPVQLNGNTIGTVGYARDITDRKTLETQLAQEHSLLKALVNAMPDLFWLKDPNGVYLACNTRFEALYGCTEAEILGKTDLDFVTPEVAAFFRANDLKAIEAGGAITNEELLRFACDGHEELTETIKTPVYGPDETLLGVLGIGRNITQRAADDAQRRALLERLQKIAAHVPGVIYEYHLRTDGTAHFPYASAGMKDVYGIEPQDTEQDSTNVINALHPDDVGGVVQSIAQSAQDLTPWREEYRVLLPDGRERWLLGQSTPQRQPDGSTLWHGYIHDITEDRINRERLRLGASVFANSYDGIMITDARNVIVEVNPAFTRITGYEAADVVGRTPAVLGSGRQGASFYQGMWQSLSAQGHWSGEVWNRRKNGELYAEILSITAVKSDDGELSHYLAVFSDITQLKTHEAELAHIAHYDVLTGVPNRRLLGDRMKVALARARRDKSTLAVCLLDLDGFKEVNDAHGHGAGDRLLVEVAQRLQSVLREDDTLARLGGDEFVLLLSNLQHPEESHTVLDRMLKKIAYPYVVGDMQVQVSGSIGLTLYPDDQSDPDTLLRHADHAMYNAKQAGKNCYQLFDPRQDQKIRVHRDQLLRLERGLNKGELVLFYQPKANLVTGEVTGAEALIRWQHPEMGLLPPSQFLPLLNGQPLEAALGEWVLHEALKQMTAWKEQGLEFVVSVNISADHLLEPGFDTRLAQTLTSYPLVNPHLLELEILETAAISDLDRASHVLSLCRALGVRFALDDFGTGYSSLAYFRNLPVDVIKIDQSFVRDMLDDPNDLSIVDGVVRLALAFNRPVIAEGVETLEHGAALVLMGCPMAQGYGVSRPMPSGQMLAWITDWHTCKPWQHLPSVCQSTEKLALQAAGRSLSQWVVSVKHTVAAIRGYTDVNADYPPCRFGHWYRSSGAAQYGNDPTFQAIARQHSELHRVADQLLSLARAGRAEDIEPLLKRLEEETLAMQSLLEQLMQ